MSARIAIAPCLRANEAEMAATFYWLGCRLVDIPDPEAQAVGLTQLVDIATRFPRVAPLVSAKLGAREQGTGEMLAEALS